MATAGLTGAHADLAVGRGAEVAVEALVWVAGVTLRAQLSQLLGADAAATASVQHQAHTSWAARRRLGALALRAAVLAGSGLRRGRGGRSVCDRSSLCPPSVLSVILEAYPTAEGEEEHHSEADGTRDHGRDSAGGCTTAGRRGEEGRGRSLDTDSGRRLVSGSSRRWRLGLSAGGGCSLEEVGLLGSELEWLWLPLLGGKSCVRLGGQRWLLYSPKRPARQRTERSPTQTGTFLAFLPTFLPHQLTPD